jgi:hypothetical protein
MKQKFEADDGTPFETAEECKAYEEQETLLDQLIGVPREDVMAAFARVNIPLADAFELAGSIISAKRRKSGELRRRKKNDGGTASTMEAIASDIKKGSFPKRSTGGA